MVGRVAILSLTAAIGSVAGSISGQEPAPTLRSTPTTPIELLRLHLVWMDPYRLLPFGFEPMTEEVGSIFARVGVGTSWERGRYSRRPGPLDITVILRKSPPPGWGLGEHAMGTTVRDAFPRVVYVFSANVMRTLGISHKTGELPTATETGLTARAMGRVIAHEVVHCFAPAHPHESAGLMCRRLTHPAFIRNRLPWTGHCADAFLDGVLRAAGQGQPADVAPASSRR
jgi:hypothetical protein